ncbi:CDP-alcohol phosphatidyltransferase family protein [Burkholderia pyrrocinia]|uniref:CDP-alcohol phosphatidyltransferase family protein n=1 Tax=Burkholderia pyrrocinia TaxID=60550 RepID=UPI001BCD9A0D|nr:CDP-alcohol phosphatidyltransferase family protein [Burkholderia pyrrocinia]QVN23400.1 CDP-alcohol phosphatidyltransferase family protein [Burkholderia pyrrocinia]
MTLYQIKPRFQALLRPFVHLLADVGGSANQVTLTAAVGSIGIGAFTAAFGPLIHAVFLLMPVWLFVRMALNAIDGMLAREHGQQSTFGAYLNELGDIVSDLALLLPFACVASCGSGEVVACAAFAVISECAGLIGPLVGATRRYDGPFGKSDRALALGALALWIGAGLPTSRHGHLLWVVFSIASIATTVNRVRRGVAEARAAGALTTQI